MAEINREFDSYEQSSPALCTHRNDVGLRDCFVPARLMITKSPLREWEFLVVERCPKHLLACWGVLDESAVDDERSTNWGMW